MQEEVPSSEEAVESPAEEEVSKGRSTKDEEAADEETNQQAEQPTSTPKSQRGRRKPSKFNAPSLKTLDDIEHEIDNDKAKSEEHKPKWEQEQLRSFFKNLAETANPPSTRTVLKNTEVHLKDGKLLLRVGSTVDKSTLLQESWILQSVREHFHKPKLQIHIEIDEEKRREGVEASRPVSKKEMLDQMIQENPIVDKLREMLSLRFDK